GVLRDDGRVLEMDLALALDAAQRLQAGARVVDFIEPDDDQIAHGKPPRSKESQQSSRRERLPHWNGAPLDGGAGERLAPNCRDPTRSGSVVQVAGPAGNDWLSSRTCRACLRSRGRWLAAPPPSQRDERD